MDEKHIIKTELDIAKIASEFMLHFNETKDCLTQIYHAIDQHSGDSHKPLPTDRFPITIDTGQPLPTIEEQKAITLNWALKNAFQDFIYGLTMSFQEAYRYLMVYKLSLETPFKRNESDIQKYFSDVEKNLQEFPFPKFIEKIELLLDKSLPLKEEILSINRIRNCLVHRHGIVDKKDVNSDSHLRLKYLIPQHFGLTGGKWVELTYEVRKNGIEVDKVKIEPIAKERNFPIGEKIRIDLNEFNDIAYTGLQFATQLFSMMPRPKAEK